MAYEPNAKLVMALRQKTGAGLMDCKKALIAAEGDEKAAIDWLREKGIASGAKKEGRVAAEGIAYVASKNGKTVLVEVNCETDFVARGEAFKEYVGKVADYILDNPTVKVEDIANNIADVTSEYTLKMGEKLSVRRYSIFDSKDGVINSYVHMGGTIGTIVLLSKGTSDEVAHEIALHVTVSSPKYISANEVPQDEIEHEKQILTAQAQAEPNPKPLNIIEKMVQGRINKYYKEVCLNDQVKYDDSDVTIAQYLKQNGGAEVLAFVRYKMGEGIEKKKDDAVDEIAESLKKAGL